MSEWRDQLLKDITPGVSSVVVVADPDALLADEGVMTELRSRGFDVLSYEDPVAFRYAYEMRKKQNTDSNLLVLVEAAYETVKKLPYDVLKSARTVSVSLAELFPRLSYPVVAALPRSYLDSLYKAQQEEQPNNRGDKETKDFILLHVFGIAPQLIKDDADLLTMLLRRHYRQENLPSVLEDRLIQRLKSQECFRKWPLEEILPDRHAFLRFLQERWPLYLDRLYVELNHGDRQGHNMATGERHSDTITMPGPHCLPFAHDDVRVYIDNFFAEGLLQPVEHEAASELEKTWVATGIKSDPEKDRAGRLERLLAIAEENTPSQDATSHAWLTFIEKWASLLFVIYESGKPVEQSLMDQFNKCRERVDTEFLTWLKTRYGGLANRPPEPPDMVHHAPRLLARRRQQEHADKVALLVIDGMAYHQWGMLREQVSDIENTKISESAVFAWVPTVTSISRQALFAGRTPYFFSKTLYRTDTERGLWEKFWQENGLTQREIAYCKGAGDAEMAQEIRERAADNLVKSFGIVITAVDKLMHTAETTSGMHAVLRDWTEQNIVGKIVEVLLDNGYYIILTSDHGNTEAVGVGKPKEGVLGEQCGQRARIYSDNTFRESVAHKFPESIQWPSSSSGLPEDCLPLIAPSGKAFIDNGKRSVCHGGVSPEELLVPFIEITRNHQVS